MDYVARSPAQLGQIIRNCRKRLDLSQQAAASKVGLKQSTVSSFEQDSSGASVETLYKLLSALGLELVVREPSAERQARGASQEW